MSSYVPPSFLFFFFLLLRRFPGENVDISRYNLLPSLPHPSSPINKDHVLLEKKKKKRYLSSEKTLLLSLPALLGIGVKLYVSEKSGSDETGDGTEGKPFATILQALRKAEVRFSLS